MRVLGVDPGTTVTGCGVIERRGSAVVHVWHGVVRPGARQSLPGKLAAIHAALVDLCRRFAPDVLALEKNFVGRNVQSAFRLGEVRGVAMLAAASAGVPVAEYAPAEVKLAVTGGGRAEKIQVARAIARELAIAEVASPDAADALAIALCHVQSSRLRGILAAHVRSVG